MILMGHIMKTVTDAELAHSENAIAEYFKSGVSPYSTKKRYKAKEVRDDE